MSFRWACDKRFRKAMVTFADNSRHASPWAADIYQRARSPGLRPSPCRAHPRPSVDTRHLALLARPLAVYNPTEHAAAAASPAPRQSPSRKISCCIGLTPRVSQGDRGLSGVEVRV